MDKKEYFEKILRQIYRGISKRTFPKHYNNLNINVQRDKKDRLRPQILPNSYKRVNEDYIDLLMSLVYNGYLESKIDSTLKSLGLTTLKQRMDIIKKTAYRKTLVSLRLR
ncbi:transposase [Sulfurihydrogenibium sp.]|jgi:transposase-like protein|uniref:transposase n=1 Tax=Sulfurihydrogenibium sp. TaxID=2053621 RepID=UPI002611935C|nr:transposase [Sulfurihydrogenibium sp.]